MAAGWGGAVLSQVGPLPRRHDLGAPLRHRAWLSPNRPGERHDGASSNNYACPQIEGRPEAGGDEVSDAYCGGHGRSPGGYPGRGTGMAPQDIRASTDSETDKSPSLGGVSA